MSENDYVVRSILYNDRQALVQFYKHNKEKIKIHRSDRCYALIDSCDAMVAAVKFSLLADGSWLLRNMLVSNSHRGRGVGHRLLSSLNTVMEELAHTKAIGADNKAGLYCFPWSELTHFYNQHGFQHCTFADDDPVESLSTEALGRFRTYRNRGLDIQCCYWPLNPSVVDKK